MTRKFIIPLIVALALATSIVVLGWTLWPAPSPEESLPVASLVKPDSPDDSMALRTMVLEIGKRDSVTALLLRNDVPATMAHEIVGTLRAAGANLRKVRPGDQFRLSRNVEGRPVSLSYAPSPWVRFELSENDGQWKATRIAIQPEVRLEVRQGKVGRSLWDAVEGGALAPKTLLNLVQIFESEFDFSADTRQGDFFRLLVEIRYANDVPVEQGRILAAQYFSDAETLTGIGFQDRTGFTYYDTQGRSLKKTFLRSPLEFTRISSGFSYRRPHPVLGGVRPHLAIDYAASVGTPVWAVAEGVVQFARRNGGNGIQVILTHRSGYQTYYNHLARVARGIRRGARVSQKQVIGYVGSTGLSTGPHLDYRVSRNGTFVNPLGERFLPGKPIAKAKQAQFLENVRVLVARLEKEAPFQL
ncbi:MAG: M23 family metallopeptidase [Betaproteobacteria bacterium]|nr:M23 family metallopeptidase [Betaproteobacteria bacterium]